MMVGSSLSSLYTKAAPDFQLLKQPFSYFLDFLLSFLALQLGSS